MIRCIWNGFLPSFIQDLMGELIGSGVPLNRGFIEYVLVELMREENGLPLSNMNVAQALRGSPSRVFSALTARQISDGWPCDGPILFAQVIVRALGEKRDTPESVRQVEHFLCTFVNALLARGKVLSPGSRIYHDTRVMDSPSDFQKVSFLPRRSS